MKRQPRENAILSRIGSIMGVLNMKIPDIARMSGIQERTLRRRMAAPGEFRQYELWAIEDAARKRGWNEI